jgi:predicted  nucleic acid-binding Zn-ribbon protein
MTCAHLNSFPQTAQEDDVMAQRSYDELEHELETLAQERTDLVLRDLLQRVERLERRIESLGPSSP